MKKVVSIALFGDADRKDGSGQNYHAYLPTFVLAHANLFSTDQGWELRVHVDAETAQSKYGTMLRKSAVKLRETATREGARLFYGHDRNQARDIRYAPHSYR